MMSKTDKTRPWRVQIDDPYNDRFKYVGNMMWAQDGTSEHYWKRIQSHKCRMCSQKHWNKPENKRKRLANRRELRNGVYE